MYIYNARYTYIGIIHFNHSQRHRSWLAHSIECGRQIDYNVMRCVLRVRRGSSIELSGAIRLRVGRWSYLTTAEIVFKFAERISFENLTKTAIPAAVLTIRSPAIDGYKVCMQIYINIDTAVCRKYTSTIEYNQQSSITLLPHHRNVISSDTHRKRRLNQSRTHTTTRSRAKPALDTRPQWRCMYIYTIIYTQCS